MMGFPGSARTFLSPTSKGKPGTADPWRIDGNTVVFTEEPVLLRRPDGVARADVLRVFMGPSAADGTPPGHRATVEAEFYVAACAMRPVFVESHGSPGVTAQDLFGAESARTRLWNLPASAKPELCVRAMRDVSVRRPGFNGELKSVVATAYDQGVMYALMDMIAIFFPSEDDKPCERRFYDNPPLGYALMAFPHTGYVLSLEWIGRVFVTVASDTFLLGSGKHESIMKALVAPVYSDPLVLKDASDGWTAPANGPTADRVSWRTTPEGRFQKLIRYDLYTRAQLVHASRTYRCLQGLFAERPAPASVPAAIVLDARLLFGAHELLVDMAAVGGEPCEDAALSEPHIAFAVAEGIVWLAGHNIVYTDVRGPNVLVEAAGGAGGGDAPPPVGAVHLVDYDDCLFVDEPVRTFDAFMKVLRGHVDAATAESPAADGAKALVGDDASMSVLIQALKDAFKAGTAAGGGSASA
jgi:hypothetical protein